MSETRVRLQLNIFLSYRRSVQEQRGDGISPSPTQPGSRRGGDCVSPSAQWSQQGDSNRRLHMAPPRPKGHGGQIVEV